MLRSRAEQQFLSIFPIVLPANTQTSPPRVRVLSFPILLKRVIVVTSIHNLRNNHDLINILLFSTATEVIKQFVFA